MELWTFAEDNIPNRRVQSDGVLWYYKEEPLEMDIVVRKGEYK